MELLYKTFDTNILDKLDEDTRQNIIQENKNTTIAKLIDNHLNKTKPIAEYIGGPYRINHMYSKEYNMNIYLFGEYHSNETDCPEDYILIENYLEQLLENTDVFLDMYFEFPGFIKDEYKSTNLMIDQRMKELFNKFYNCVQKLSRNNPKCQLARIHYIDIRSFEDTYIGSDDLLWVVNTFDFRNVGYLEQLEIFSKNYSRIIDIILKLLKFNKEQYKSYVFEQITKHPYLQKEVDRSYLYVNIMHFMSETLNNAIDELYNEIKTLVIKIAQLLPQFQKEEISKQIFDLIKILHSCFLDIVSRIMDGYSLGRIFKEFNVTNEEQPKRAHNIIYYAGSFHTEYICDFLIKNGFENIESVSKGNYKNCIDMKGIKQPLFNNFLV